MNSLIFDIRRYSIHDGPGIRTTVFFKGCPLRCQWCHNPESQELSIEKVSVQRVLDGKAFETKMTVGSWQSAEDVIKEIEKDEIFYQESGGGVTFSGGEPLMQPEALIEILELCRKRKIHTTIDTCGHAEPSVISRVMKLADLWLFDLKLIDDEEHMKYTGVSNQQALKNLETLAGAGKNIIIRIPLIPGITDTDKNLEDIALLMKRLNLNQIDVLPYHAIAREKYRRLGKEYLLGSVKELNDKELDEIREFFAGEGLTVGIRG